MMNINSKNINREYSVDANFVGVMNRVSAKAEIKGEVVSLTSTVSRADLLHINLDLNDPTKLDITLGLPSVTNTFTGDVDRLVDAREKVLKQDLENQKGQFDELSREMRCIIDGLKTVISKDFPEIMLGVGSTAKNLHLFDKEENEREKNRAQWESDSRTAAYRRTAEEQKARKNIDEEFADPTK